MSLYSISLFFALLWVTALALAQNDISSFSVNVHYPPDSFANIIVSSSTSSPTNSHNSFVSIQINNMNQLNVSQDGTSCSVNPASTSSVSSSSSSGAEQVSSSFSSSLAASSSISSSLSSSSSSLIASSSSSSSSSEATSSSGSSSLSSSGLSVTSSSSSIPSSSSITSSTLSSSSSSSSSLSSPNMNVQFSYPLTNDTAQEITTQNNNSVIINTITYFPLLNLSRYDGTRGWSSYWKNNMMAIPIVFPLPRSSYTKSIWVKCTSDTGSHQYFQSSSWLWNASRHNMYIVSPTRNINCDHNGYTVTSNITLSLNAWTNVICMYSQSSQTLSLYLNGTLVGSTGSVPVASNETGPFVLGAYQMVGTGVAFTYQGYLQGFLVYNATLSSPQIQSLVAANTPLPIGYNTAPITLSSPYPILPLKMAANQGRLINQTLRFKKGVQMQGDTGGLYNPPVLSACNDYLALNLSFYTTKLIQSWCWNNRNHNNYPLFVPQIWTGNVIASAITYYPFATIFETPYLDPTAPLLFTFNEPDQSYNLQDPTAAASMWWVLEQTGKLLISPSFDDFSMFSWYTTFQTACQGYYQRNCRIDAFSVHVYTCGVSLFESYIQLFFQFFNTNSPGTPVLVDEFGCGEDQTEYGALINYYPTMQFLESQSNVVGYSAWNMRQVVIPSLGCGVGIGPYICATFFTPWAYADMYQTNPALLVVKNWNLTDLGNMYAQFPLVPAYFNLSAIPSCTSTQTCSLLFGYALQSNLVDASNNSIALSSSVFPFTAYFAYSGTSYLYQTNTAAYLVTQSLSSYVTNNEGFALMCWTFVQENSGAPNQANYIFGDSSALAVWFSQGVSWQFSVNGGNPYNNVVDAVSTPTHIAIIYDPVFQTFGLYVNATARGETYYGAYTTNTIELFAAIQQSSGFANGIGLRDCRMYTGQIQPSDLAYFMNHAVPPSYPACTGSGCQLIARYELNNTLIDSSGNGFTLTPNTAFGSNYQYVYDSFRNNYVLDQFATGSAFMLANNVLIPAYRSWTVLGWYFSPPFGAPNTDQHILGDSYNFMLYSTSNAANLNSIIHFVDMGGVTITANEATPVNTWVHVAISYNYPNQVLLYLNGTIQGSGNAPSYSLQQLELYGAYLTQYTLQVYSLIPGTLFSDMRVYAGILSQSSIQAYMNQPLPYTSCTQSNACQLVAQFPLNHTLLDTSGNGYNLSTTSNFTQFYQYVYDPFRQRTVLSQYTTGSFLIANNPTLVATNSWTVMGWYNSPPFGASNTDQHIFGDSYNFMLYSDSNGTNLNSIVHSVDVSGTTFPALTLVPTNTWVHVAISYNSPTQTTILYLNGTIQGTAIVSPYTFHQLELYGAYLTQYTLQVYSLIANTLMSDFRLYSGIVSQQDIHMFMGT